MDLGLIIALASLGFTALGTIAAVISIRQNRHRGYAAVVNYGPARGILRSHFGYTNNVEGALSIIAQFIFVDSTGRTVFGVWDRMTSSVFLDLFSACTTNLSNRTIIARLIADSISEHKKPEQPTHIAVAKEGNVLVADEVAKQLKLKLVVVRTRDAIRFGNPIEGLMLNGAYVIIVDDVAADGKMLTRAVRRLRQYGGRVEQAFCAVERLDGNSSEALAASDVTLIAPIKLDERTLRELRHLPTSPPRNGPLDHPPLDGSPET